MGGNRMLRNDDHHICDVKQLFEKSAEKYKEKTAFWMKDENQAHTSITYKQLYRDVRGLGTSLISLGMKDKRVAIIGRNSYEWVVSYLTALCATGGAVLLDKEFSLPELKYFLNVSEASCVIFSNELEDIFWQIKNDGVTGLETLISMDKEKSQGEILSFRELIEEGMQEEASGDCSFSSERKTPDNLCSIVFTAGTTGVPKGVKLSHLNIATELTLVSQVLKINENCIFFSKFPFHCAAECICGILLPLVNGASITCNEDFNYNFEISKAAGYSLTECSSIAALNPDNNSAGLLLPGMKVKIEQIDPETGIGEICLAGENIMTGYCDNPELTDKVLKEGWLYTGDLGRIDERGHIYISGRKENIIVREKGKYICPEELEKILKSIPLIDECMVWGKDSYENKAPEIVATIVVNSEKIAEKLGKHYSKQESDALLWGEINRINEGLPLYKQIKNVVIKNGEFQKNSSNKIIRYYPANKS